MLNKNEIIELVITDFDYDGYGISHHDGYTIFVANSLIGEKVLAKILKVNKTIAFAKTETILSSSKERREPPCPYYQLCGGCNLMHLSYNEQLKVKVNALRNTLNKMIDVKDINPIVKADNIYNYRNKISLPVGSDENGLIVGFYQKRSHHIIPSTNCLLEQSGAREIVNEVLSILNKNKFSAYDEISFKGDIRHLVLRANHKGEFMLCVVANNNIEKLKKVLSNLNINNLVSIYINVNQYHNNVILSKDFIHIAGQEVLEEEILGQKYLIHPNSFLQVNYEMMEKLYNTAISKLSLSGNETVLDSYCGVGTIGLSFANRVGKIIGVEIEEEAVINAKENAKRNNINNAFFYADSSENFINNLENEKIDILVMDPPRSGSKESFLEAVCKRQIEKIVYISCGPTSLARDLKYLLDNGYQLTDVIPVDLFPNTSHVETVCCLVKQK